MSMKYVNRLIQNEQYLKVMGQIHEMEKDRIYCHHGFNHLLDVARIAHLMNLEFDFGYDKEFIYLCALLHDIGRAQEYLTGVPHEIAGEKLAVQLLDEIECPEEYRAQILEKVVNHRHLEMKNQEISRDNFFWYADKKARNCFACNAADTCNWPLEKRTMEVNW